MGAVISRLLYGKKKWGKYAVLLRLPNEVLFDAFKFLNRRQLTNLERVCLRFYRIINDHMGEAPFHRLRLPIGFRFDASEFQPFIIDAEKAAFITDLNYFHFLRFKSVYLIYALGSQSIDEKLQLFQNRLQLFGTALSNLEKIILSADINKNDQSQFRDHSQLLDHLREQVLPICQSSPAYHFIIDFQSDNDGTADFIAQILQLPSINRCRAVYFQYKNETFIQLPVEIISNWLNRNSDDGIGGIEHGKKRLFLAMNNRIKIQNAAEICDHLKMVFNGADSPVYPFLFAFNGGPLQLVWESISNEKTNEILSIDYDESDEDGISVAIKRCAKDKKNSRETE